MQKSLDRSDLLINSVIAVDHLSSFVYVEVAKEFHVKHAIKGLNTVIHSTKLMLVPQKEMPSVVSVEGKAIDVRKDSWVRMKIGICKGDLGKVVDVDNVCRQVTVQLIPSIDLQALAEKLNGLDVNKKYIVPRPRLFNFEASDLSFGVIIRVEKEMFEVLRSIPDRPQTVMVNSSEIRSKIKRLTSAKDRPNNTLC